MQLGLELQSTKKGSMSMIDYIMKIKENRLEQQSSIEQMSANYASSSNNKGGERKFNGGRGQGYAPNNNNYTYRGHGHGGRNGQSGRQNSSPSEKPQCQLCGKFGHIGSVITGLISFLRWSTTTSPSLNNGNQNNILAMVASSSNSPADESWYLDSGASHHLTQNLGNLTNTSPYTGTDRVTIGLTYEDGSCSRQA
ncbi:hypothetical protein AAG906_000412 [Vitis piasezkii]